MTTIPLKYRRIVATEAAELEAALYAAGHDPDAPEHYPIWTLWQHRGLDAALAALEQKEELPMPIEIRYSPARFAPVPHLKRGAPAQEAQIVWQQIDRETWLQLEIRRNPTSYNPTPYVKEARLMRGQQSGGGWQQAHHYANPADLQLVEDASAPDAPEPAPAPAENAATAYIAQNYNAAAALGERPNIDEIRTKQGMY